MSFNCFCCVRLSFFSTTPRDRLGRTSPKWPILCRVGSKTLTQSMRHMRTVFCDAFWRTWDWRVRWRAWQLLQFRVSWRPSSCKRPSCCSQLSSWQASHFTISLTAWHVCVMRVPDIRKTSGIVSKTNIQLRRSTPHCGVHCIWKRQTFASLSSQTPRPIRIPFQIYHFVHTWSWFAKFGLNRFSRLRSVYAWKMVFWCVFLLPKYPFHCLGSMPHFWGWF